MVETLAGDDAAAERDLRRQLPLGDAEPRDGLEPVRLEHLGGHEGKGGGQITMKRLSLYDVDGNKVGLQRIACWVANRNWVCSFVSKIQDGPNTDQGTVVGFGAKPLVHQDEVLVAITGGTGAYENVGGHAEVVGGTGETTYTVFLLP